MQPREGVKVGKKEREREKREKSGERKKGEREDYEKEKEKRRKTQGTPSKFATTKRIFLVMFGRMQAKI